MREGEAEEERVKGRGGGKKRIVHVYGGTWFSK